MDLATTKGYRDNAWWAKQMGHAVKDLGESCWQSLYIVVTAAVSSTWALCSFKTFLLGGSTCHHTLSK